MADEHGPPLEPTNDHGRHETDDMMVDKDAQFSTAYPSPPLPTHEHLLHHVTSHSSLSSIGSAQTDPVNSMTLDQLVYHGWLSVHEGSSLNANTDMRLQRINYLLPEIKYFGTTFGQIAEECAARYRQDENNQDLFSIVRDLEVLAVKLSTSGLVLLFLETAVRDFLRQIRQRLALMPCMVPEPASDPTLMPSVDVEEKEQNGLSEAIRKLEKNKCRTNKLFRKLKLRPEDRDRFLLPAEYLEYSMPAIDTDDISETFEGKIIGGTHIGNQVHVRKITNIECGCVDEIIERTLYLTHFLRDCENIARPRCAVLSQHILVMPPITNMTLEQALKTTTLNVAQKVDVALKAASALAFVHWFGVVHRDVQPSKILLSSVLRKDGRSVCVPKLTGFEMCRVPFNDYSVGPKDTQSLRSAPEMVRGYGSTYKTDIYAFGVLLYEISMGKLPAAPSGVDAWHAQEFKNVSEEYSGLMRDCIQKDFEMRPTMTKVAERLAEIVCSI